MRNPDATQAAALERLLQLVGEREARRLLSELARPAVSAELERLVLRRMAEKLLAENEARPVIRDRLVSSGGINWRTAYRVIEEALSIPPERRCVNGETSVTSRPDRLKTSQQSDESSMALQLETMRAQLRDLIAQRDTINLQALDSAARTAERDYEAHKKQIQDLQATLLSADRDRAQMLFVQDHARLATAARNARHEFDCAQRKHGELSVRVTRLDRLLNSETYIAGAERLQARAQAAAQDAHVKAEGCRRTVATLAALIAEEQQQLESGKATAAAELLAAVKAGTSSPTLPKTGNAEKLSTLEAAHAGAVAELAAADAALQTATKDLQAAEREVKVRLAARAELAHEIAFAEYAETLAKTMAAHHAARLEPFYPPQPIDAARALLAQMEQEQR